MSGENNVVSFPDGKAKKAAAKNRGKSHGSHIERLIGLRNEHQKKVDEYQKRVEILDFAVKLLRRQVSRL
jgi:hypothetical protein